MPTIRQLIDSAEFPNGRERIAPAKPRTRKKPLIMVKSGTSAIEFIVKTAKPGEVIHVSDEDYFNPHLWRSYIDA